MLLGVNIDHIATLREARAINDPDPLEAVFIAKRAGADQITLHLREDRRHMHDSDVERIIQSSFLPINVESSINPQIIEFLLKLRPHRITLVPENRQEITTEGGLDVLGNFTRIQEITKECKKIGTEVSLFIDTNLETLCSTKEVGADMVELHTGTYANLHLMLFSNLSRTQHSIKELELPKEELKELYLNSIKDLQNASKEAKWLGLEVAAGHGLNYHNLTPILQIQEIIELNIGQSIIAKSIFTGLENAIKEMVELIK
ncbi:pyridoxine 5'-phosphate synthase [Helicobacter valdiviensis]|uniref:Pyridoxine 5'-phosphate synthase n=1 Tax=Helicobacter valdiviensis TaxID=1458358 RepID=A0A2W6MWY5_9HELI|nr:pyridoxine 5'-phosphate synthase [Helicobacter valdiviensis]PZT48479.1 pyridoxine 5'-phosphate synthase [Helicobacter valdiviensis]